MGTLVGVTLFTKLDGRDQNISLKPLSGDDSKRILYYYWSSLSIPTNLNSFNLTVLNSCLLAFFIFANIIKWCFFGTLSQREVEKLKNKINYTIWEFIFGGLIFLRDINNNDKLKNSNDSTSQIIQKELFKFSGLFLCVLLLKCFHSLSADRAYTLTCYTPHSHLSSYKSQIMRFSCGIVILNLVDLLLMGFFFYETYYNYSGNKVLSFKDNILVAIFGFEIINMYPSIFLTTVKFVAAYLHDSTFPNNNAKSLQVNKSKYVNLFDFFINFTTFSMTFIFAGIFLYYYTFPIHILPSSYLSLRLLIIKSRCLISLKKKKLKLNQPLDYDTDMKCTICFDYLNDCESDGVRCLYECNHNFHYTCLKNWLQYSACCPNCRTKV